MIGETNARLWSLSLPDHGWRRSGSLDPHQGREADVRLIDDAAGAVTEPFWRNELLTRCLFVMGYSGGPRAAVDAGSALLQHARSGPLTAAHTTVFYGLARLGRLDEAIRLLYDLLLRIAPNPAVSLNRPVAVGKPDGAAAMLAALDTIAARVRSNLWHAARADALRQLCRTGEAKRS